MILTKSMIRFIRMSRSIVRSEQLLRYKKSGGNIMLPPDHIDVFC